MQRREDEVAGLTCLEGNVGGFLVADLADHDNIRVLPQYGTQARSKGDPRLGVDMDLVHPWDVIFHRVLDSDDIDLRRVQLVEAGVQGG